MAQAIREAVLCFRFLPDVRSNLEPGSRSNTVIGEATKVDGPVQIARHVVIGRHCIIVAQSGIADSSELEGFVVRALIPVCPGPSSEKRSPDRLYGAPKVCAQPRVKMGGTLTHAFQEIGARAKLPP